MASNILKRIAQALTIIMGGILWRLGGNGLKWCRLYVLPCLIAGVKFFITGNWVTLLYAPLLMLLLSVFSYGLSSWVHKLWVWVFKKGSSGDILAVEIATRATCGFFWSLASIWFIMNTNGLLHQAIYTAFLTIAIAIFGTNKNVWVSEIGSGASTSCAILI